MTAAKKTAKRAADGKPVKKARPKVAAPAFSAAEPARSKESTSPLPAGANSLILSTRQVPVSELRLYYKNPRQGDVESIADSLKHNGQFKPIVVNLGKQTGRHNEVLAGNHTLLAARRNGWETITASFVDVDEVTAATIVAADNRTSDKGGYDETILASLLAGLPSAEGTGYTADEVDAIIAAIPNDDLDAMSVDADAVAAGYRDDLAEGQAADTFEGSALGEEPDDFDDDDARPQLRREAPEEAIDTTGAGDEIGEAGDELRGAKTLKSPMDMDYGKTQGFWELPKLRGDMLMALSDLPPSERLYAWCGPITKTWAEDPDTAWWFYQWGVDGTSAMPDVSKVVVGFYAFDDRFENWWWYPERYMAKVINSGIKLMVMPDFSEDHPRVEALWSLYRSLYLGRYFQECGQKVAPNLAWLDQDEEFLTKVVIPSLPTNAPLMAMQLQTVKANTDEEKEALQRTYKHLQMALDALQPQNLLFYCGRQAADIFDDGTITYPGTVYKVRSRTDMIAEWQAATGQRKPKTTI